MKALIISDDTNIIYKLDNFLSEIGFNTIIYRWLLKALDNIEEIRPDCVIVSSSEYPRHWKTLVQFIKSGIGGNKIAVYLYEPNPLSDEDEQKAKTLGINGCFSKIEDEDLALLKENITDFFGLNKLEIQKETEKNEKLVNLENFTSEIGGTGHIIFTNPISQKFINGTYFDKKEKQITVKLDYNESIDDLRVSTLIPEFTYFNSNECKTVSCILKQVLDINGEHLIIFEMDN